MNANNKSAFKMLIILQTATVLIVVVFLLAVKFTGWSVFENLTLLYNRYGADETVIDEVSDLEEEDDVLETGAIQVQTMPQVQKMNILSNSFILPLKGTVTSGFGHRDDPFTSECVKHYGKDIASDTGTEIYAAAGGRVKVVNFDENGYGKYLTIDHNEHIKTLYGHCSEIIVKPGDTVLPGQVIAYVGNTGASTGSHLHFEIRLDGVPVDPDWYIDFGD